MQFHWKMETTTKIDNGNDNNYRESKCCMNCVIHKLDADEMIFQALADTTTPLLCSLSNKKVCEYWVCDKFKKC